MYLKLEISTTRLRSLFWEATGNDWSYCYLGSPVPHCALCGAREYPYWFSFPHPWPRLHKVVTFITEEQDGKQVAVLTGDTGASLYLPVEDIKVYWDDTTYLYHFCRYHGRPETSGWVDSLTAIPIEWFLEPSEMGLALLNTVTRLAYILWVTGRFLWSLLTLRFIAIRFEVKRSL